MIKTTKHNKYNDDALMGSERSFGFVFATVFFIIAGLPLLSEDGQPIIWAAIVSFIFILLAFLAPKTLKPLNIIWFKFGLLLHKIVSPIMMTLVYVLTILPIGLMLKLFNKDLLRQKQQPNADTYWIKREEPGPSAESFKNQF